MENLIISILLMPYEPGNSSIPEIQVHRSTQETIQSGSVKIEDSESYCRVRSYSSSPTPAAAVVLSVTCYRELRNFAPPPLAQSRGTAHARDGDILSTYR